jgi:uncharacterized coiled-coil protein SlyX
MKATGFGMVLVVTGAVLIISKVGAAQTGIPDAALTKTIEERLAELEQKQTAAEKQLEIERTRTAELEEVLSQTRAQLEELKQAAKTPPASSVPAVPPPQPQIERQQIEQIVDQRLEAKKSDFAVPEWVKNMQIKGDFRYRHEWTDDETKTSDRNRDRIRARIGVYGKVDEEFDYGFRLASGNDESPTSTNQDLGDSFSKKELWLDLAYVDYHPASVKGLNVYGGKIKNPYYTVGNSDLMFDTDVNPEGIAGKYVTKVSDTTELFAVAGGYYVTERDTEAETSLWGFQGGVKYDLDKDQGQYITVGGGYYDYGNLKGTALTFPSPANFFGNSTTDGGFAKDFNIVQAFAEYGFNYGNIPVRLFLDYDNNTAADNNDDNAYLAGLMIGDNKKAGDWQFGYNYRDIEADSLVGVFTDGTFGGGGTNVKGHKFSIGYQIAKNVDITTSYYMAERTRTETTDHDVVTVDFNLKF